MPLDTSVNNVGEYYSAHYLEHQFVKDIQGPVRAWRELGTQFPRRLQALGDTYFRAKAQALDYDRAELRIKPRQPNCPLARQFPPRARLFAGTRVPYPGGGKGGSARSVPHIALRQAVAGGGGDAILSARCRYTLRLGQRNSLEQVVPPGRPRMAPDIYAASWGEAVGRLLREEDSPRWVLLLSGTLIYLFDRSTFSQGRWLGFDLDDAFGRKDAASFEAIAALLSAETLCPDGESTSVLHDTLEGQSHKFTHGVSAKLQSAVRRAIEEVCNGWVDYRRERKLSYRMLAEHEPALPGGRREVTADQLRNEALVFVYRILFCLYAEARGGELGILPINDDIYRLGYSLEALRDPADAGEMPMQAENGIYYHSHLKQLFDLIHKGHQPAPEPPVEPTELWAAAKPEQLTMFNEGPAAPRQLRLDQAGRKIIDSDGSTSGGFTVRPLTATLFDPQATPLLDRATCPISDFNG